MSPTQNEFSQSMFTPRDLFGDNIDDENNNGNGKTSLLPYSVAGTVGFVIGAGIAHNSNLGPGGAELVPMIGAGIGVLVLRVRDSIVRAWNEFAYAEGLD